MNDPLRPMLTPGLVAVALLLASGCAQEEADHAATPTAEAPAAAATMPADPGLPGACEVLADLDIDGVAIGQAAVLDARVAAALPGAPATRTEVRHCRVTGYIDETVGFELLLPEDWNGKFAMGGGGGFVGSIQNSAQDTAPPGRSPLELGYATSGTDTGHQADGLDASWALNNQKAKDDFGHVAVHRTAEVSKAIIAAYYESGVDRSYFLGCSRGGGQALMEAQRYPEDFDGIVAGAPAMDWTGVTAEFIQNQMAIYPDPTDFSSPRISSANRELLAASILAQCDAIDGFEDGVLTDPRSCPFDPALLPRCEGSAGDDCVTEAQLAAIQAVYSGPVIDGERVYPGFPFGGEVLGWPVWITGGAGLPLPVPSLHYGFGTQLAKNFLYSDPDWTYSGYAFDDWAEVAAPVAALLNSTDPDLAAFDAAGGKLVLWHGWSDSALSALDSIDYYEAAAALDPNVGDHLRMFLLPGVAHCGGGPGADLVDWLTVIEGWVERDDAPEVVVATKLDATGDVTMQRPVCAYPEQAIYDGSGDPSVAASFSCGMPAD